MHFPWRLPLSLTLSAFPSKLALASALLAASAQVPTVPPLPEAEDETPPAAVEMPSQLVGADVRRDWGPGPHRSQMGRRAARTDHLSLSERLDAILARDESDPAEAARPQPEDTGTPPPARDLKPPMRPGENVADLSADAVSPPEATGDEATPPDEAPAVARTNVAPEAAPAVEAHGTAPGDEGSDLAVVATAPAPAQPKPATTDAPPSEEPVAPLASVGEQQPSVASADEASDEAPEPARTAAAQAPDHADNWRFNGEDAPSDYRPPNEAYLPATGPVSLRGARARASFDRATLVNLPSNRHDAGLYAELDRAEETAREALARARNAERDARQARAERDAAVRERDLLLSATPAPTPAEEAAPENVPREPEIETGPLPPGLPAPELDREPFQGNFDVVEAERILRFFAEDPRDAGATEDLEVTLPFVVPDLSTPIDNQPLPPDDGSTEEPPGL